ncbi:MAG: hypothetical protein NVSMB2_12380 [Chloroflexota bacterium]
MTCIDRLYTVCLRWYLLASNSAASRARGQSTVEYALVGALVVIAAAGALTLLGGQLNSVFSSISKTLSTAAAR